MSTRRIIFGFLVCFSMAVFVGQTLSQTRGRSKRVRLRNTNQEQKQQALEQHKLKLQQLKKQMGLGKSEKESPTKSEKELMKQILRATEKQWEAIEAKVNKVRELRSLANVSIKLRLMGGGIGIGGMSGSRGGTVQKRDSAGSSSSPSGL